MKLARLCLIAILAASCVVSAHAAKVKTKPLKPDVRQKIHTVLVESQLPTQFEYLSEGLMRGSERKDLIPDAGEFLSTLTANVKKGLETRGYTIANEPAEADAVLALERVPVKLPTPDEDVATAGFLEVRSFGVSFGVFAVARVNFQVKDPKTGTQLAIVSVTRYVPTNVKMGKRKWAEFSVGDQKMMLSLLGTQLSTVPEDGLKELKF